jgi:solute carrier family 35, member C2
MSGNLISLSLFHTFVKIDMIYFMQPYMLISLLPFAIVFESAKLFEHASLLLDMDSFEILALWIKISIGAFLAFFMEISEFLVLSQTSSLTLSVSGIFKEICQLVLAVEINNEQLSLYNLIGLILCLGGITSHVIYKYWMMTDNTPERQHSMDTSDCHYDMNNQYSTKFDKQKRSGPANGNLNEIKTSTSNGTSVVIAYNAGNQKAPLLNYDDSDDDDDNEMDSKSAEVLFDILKRREETRK